MKVYNLTVKYYLYTVKLSVQLTLNLSKEWCQRSSVVELSLEAGGMRESDPLR